MKATKDFSRTSRFSSGNFSLVNSRSSVPSIAVVSGAKGAAHVLKRGPDGSYVSVPVTEIGTLEGKSAVRPTTAGALRAGDAVKVG